VNAINGNRTMGKRNALAQLSDSALVVHRATCLKTRTRRELLVTQQRVPTRK
jgi:hypothetical protein